MVFFLVTVHRKVAEGAEGYLFLLFAEGPKSKKTQPRRMNADYKDSKYKELIE